jgi:hypothetical protein
MNERERQAEAQDHEERERRAEDRNLTEVVHHRSHLLLRRLAWKERDFCGLLELCRRRVEIRKSLE